MTITKVVALGAVATFVCGCAGTEGYRLDHVHALPRTAPGAQPAHGTAFETIAVDPEEWARLEKHRLEPVCDLRGAAPKVGPTWPDLEKTVAEFTVRENGRLDREKKDAAATAHAAASVHFQVKTGDIDVKQVELACAKDKPILTVNGTAFPGDVLYAERRELRNTTSGEQRGMFLIFDRKSGQLGGLALRYPTKITTRDPEDGRNDPSPTFSIANVGPFVPANAGDPIVHRVPTSDPDDGKAWFDDKYEILFEVPGVSPRQGVYFVAPWIGVFDNDEVRGNRFEVK